MADAQPEGLDFRTDGAIAVLTIDNTAEQNRLTDAAIHKLAGIVESLKARDDIHVVVIRGTGPDHFSAGILNPVLRGQMSKEDVMALVVRAASLFDAIEALPQIVIAGINGIVRAGGVELALACDIRLVASHARMSLPEAKWGGFPGAGGPLRLARLIGRASALDLICTGREADAEEMQRLGFAQQVVSPRQFDHTLWAFAREIGESGPLAVRGAKKIMQISEEPGFKAASTAALELRRNLEWSADVDEGIRAHNEGRKPRFVGH